MGLEILRFYATQEMIAKIEDYFEVTRDENLRNISERLEGSRATQHHRAQIQRLQSLLRCRFQCREDIQGVP
ncbi:unnamed protein product [Acanthoscelides obtectus]|uniref:Uncharacterized protein n=1 Tax=Acanthoscelides obtectus TaxID=200917 RepID=A0A9P0JQB8_ACAOB|nr:unnamed protein product [Acanthoscelides obtectus]CAK1661807.1 hypothetical protein AOBTE_LOCUS22811 [Acanthoscelides obtectus]